MLMDDPGPKRGRPKKDPTEKKRQSVSLRIRDAVKAELVAASEKSGLSISEEIERRVEQSFEKPKLINDVIEFTKRALFGKKHTQDLVQRISMAVSQVESAIGKDWNEDYLTRWESKEAATEVIEVVFYVDRPPPKKDYQLPDGKGIIVGGVGRNIGNINARLNKLPEVLAARGKDSEE